MYRNTAKGLAALGRKGDDTLLHVNKEELAGLQALLGPISVNPQTGLPEAFAWTDILKMLGVGVASAMTGGAAAPAMGALGGAVVGAGTGALVGGAVDAATGKGFTKNILGNALSGAISGYGGSTLNQAPGTATPAIESPAAITNQPLSAASAAYKAPAITDPAAITAQKPSDILGVKGLNPTERMTSMSVQPSLGSADKIVDIAGPKLSKSPAGLIEAPISTDTATRAATMPEPGMLSGYGKELGGMWDKLWSKEGGEAAFKYGIPAVGMGLSLQDYSDPNAQKNADIAQAIQNEKDRQYFTGLGFGWSPNINVPQQVGRTVGYGSGFAIGGPVEMNTSVGGTPLNINMPARYADEFVNSGAPERLERMGFGDVTPGFAQGGYINLQPMGEQEHPQALIPRAQPYAAASPQRREVVQGFDEGGLIEGPGDGMSDDIDANIEGVEPVRVADGEYHVTARQVALLGGGDPKKGAAILDAMVKHIRAKAYKDAHKGGQVKQDAGKLAAEKMFQRAARS